MATRGHYTPDEVWEMTLDDAERLIGYWSRIPPLRDLVSIIAQALGWDGSGRGLPVEGDDAPAALFEVPGEFED